MGNTKLANPAPLGLMGFGMTTILLNLANSGLFAFDVAILAMGHFLRRYCADFRRPAGI
ncbi:Inner membrane protein yaaH [Raoultella terrigena]|uniref:Inner membrane protein yaaH n=1 Tax=Raoultella terrigena TaxID=577 RepID=A0A485AYB6_RAOTE|nr:Inner membrane protein yaaH [Raoultella terrigena]